MRAAFLSLALLLTSTGMAAAKKEPPEAPKAYVSAVGDMVLDYGFKETILNKVQKREGLEARLDYPFEKIKPQLKGIVFGNLEAPITSESIKRFADKNERFYFRSPTHSAKSLDRAGFTVLSLANNHIKDAGVEGMLESRRLLFKLGIGAVGVGKNAEKAKRPVYVRQGDARVAFLAFDLVLPKSVWATAKRPGAATGNLKTMAAAVKAAKVSATAVAVSLHWGEEVTKDLPVAKPTATQKKIARGLIDAGASLVLGHHSHAFGKIEEYKRGLIAYSLGNFIFAGTTRSGHPHSAILQARLIGDKVSYYKVVPVLIDPAKTKYQPRFVSEKTGRKLIKRWVSTKAKKHRNFYRKKAKKKSK